MANVLMDKFILAMYSLGNQGTNVVSEPVLLEHGFTKSDLFSASESAENRGLAKPSYTLSSPVGFYLTPKGCSYAEALLDDRGLD
jgi:hypothetical protein